MEFRAMDALTRPNPTVRDWVIRASAEHCVQNGVNMLDEKAVRVCIVVGAAQLHADNCISYITYLTPLGWTKLVADVRLAVQWATEQKWSF